MSKSAEGLRANKKARILLAAVLVVAGLILAVKIISSPAVGTINSSQSEGAVAQASLETLSGKNFNLSYPNNYSLEDTGQHAVNILESYRLLTAPARGGTARLVAVTVYEVPSGNLMDTSAYKSRKDKPGEYQEETVQINGYQAQLVTSNLTSETVAFIKKGSMVATVAFSGGINAEGAEDEYSQILNSWQWH